MISREMFLVYFKRNHKLDEKPLIMSPSRQEALDFCKDMKKSSRDYEIVPIQLMVGIHREPCKKTNTKHHIPLDLNKTAYPIKCDICELTAVYFCDFHSGVYCIDHIVDHGGTFQDVSDVNYEILKKIHDSYTESSRS